MENHKRIIAFLLALTMVLSMVFQAFAAVKGYERPEPAASSAVKVTGKWSLDAQGNRTFTSNDGSRVKNGWFLLNSVDSPKEYKWYCFDENGIMKTGWINDKKDPLIWYYAGEANDALKGSMITGWLTDPQDGKKYYLDPATGIMSYGWKQIEGKWYYFGERRYADTKWTVDANGHWVAGKGKHSFGSMYVNERTPDGYYVGADGAWDGKGKKTGSSGGSYRPYRKTDNTATLIPGGKYPGVYEVRVSANGDAMATIDIPSIAKQTLEAKPTRESPAIIMGAAVPFERKTGLTEFTRTDGGTGETGIYAPYSKFRYQIMEEKGADGTIHRKLSGFDGSYVIIRVDVSELINAVPLADRAGSYLHVKQEGNAALMVKMGPGGTEASPTFSDALGNEAGVYSLADNAAALKDTSGDLKYKPYIDVILMSSGTLVAGADIGITDPTKPTADFKLKLYVDKTKDYNPGLIYDPAYQPAEPTSPTMETLMMGKYFYDETLEYPKGQPKGYPEGTVKPDAAVSSYKVMGSELELEVMHGDDGVSGFTKQDIEYWSLRKALDYKPYNNTPIKMFCEVPILEGLSVDGTDYSGERKVIFDVNSFDIQIANHKETGVAGLTIKNAAMELMDGFNTTGAELAVGNNATMNILEGGTFIIDDTCQLEVEYDAASVLPEDPTPPPLDCGIITVENGGKIINNGVITIEGREGKPIDPTTPTEREIKNAIMVIREGGMLENNGCLLSYGELYTMGTIENNGKYNDVIESRDPDKGAFTYHKGIQISWKDDVTQDSVYMGHLYIGQDVEKRCYPGARLVNKGDIVLVPGILECYGILENADGGQVHVCPVEEAIIPVLPTVDQPLVVEKRVRFGVPMKSYLNINESGNLNNAGTIRASGVEIVSNGRTGKLTNMEPDDRLFSGLALNVLGSASNSGNVVLDGVYTFGEMTNTGTIGTKVVVSSNDNQEGILYDKAEPKLTEVYNASCEAEGSTNIWSHVLCSKLEVTPATQSCTGGEKPSWNIKASSEKGGNDIKYWIDVFPSISSGSEATYYKIPAGTETPVEGPVLPKVNSNIVYEFIVLDGANLIDDIASVTVSSQYVNPPSPIGDLVYNGKNQELVTTGGSDSGNLEYRLGVSGTWSRDVPAAKDAGIYEVYYRKQSTDDVKGPVNIVIAKRPVVVSAVDMTSKAGDALKTPDYTVSGIVEGEELDGVKITCDANKDVAGRYSINVNVTGDNPNYDFSSNEINNGVYTVTKGNLEAAAKDKYGVFSDEITYTGFNIDLTVTPSTVPVYYSLTQELTDDNYQTAGYTSDTLPNLPAGAGNHTVYYYITDGNDVIRGSKKVVIEKAQQKAPEKLFAHPATAENTGDGYIEGFVPRAMEYRRSDNDGTYTTAYYGKEYVIPGIYLVRMKGDDNHYPSPNCMLTVEDGPSITVSFYLDQDYTIPYRKENNLKAGDLVPEPATPSDPEEKGRTFIGWNYGIIPFNFGKPVTMNTALVAVWDDSQLHMHNLQLVAAKEAGNGEIGNKAYYECTECPRWFEDATALVEIKDRSSVIIEEQEDEEVE